MRLLKVAAGALNQTPMAWDENQRHIAEAIETARREGASLLCLPELCVTGYGCEDAFHAPGVQQQALRVVGELAPLTGGLVVCVGLPFWVQNGLFNVVGLIADGRILGWVAKKHLAGEGLHYEPRWFKAWPEGRVVSVSVGEQSHPFGDVHFDVGGIRIGFEICEDAWVANRSGGRLSQNGVDVILNPSASHFAFGKEEVRRRLVLEGSRAFNVTYLYANLLGNEAGRAIYDGGTMVATCGRLVAAGPRFSYRDLHITTAVVDVDSTRVLQARTGGVHPEIDDRRSDLVRVPFDWAEAEPVEPDASRPAWEGGARVKEEEFTRAVSLALFDYVRKSRSHGIVISVSGGADSAACAVLAGMMIRLAAQEIGLEGVRARLGYIPGVSDAENAAGIVRRLLTCVYQSTENSTETTRAAAREVTAAVGGEFVEFDVQGQVERYVEIVSRAVGRPLRWETDDLALQNIQARARAPGVWLLANLRKALLVSTSNRSEAAVGYATMDGDTCGGLSPIAGIDKAFLRQWLRWLELEGPAGVGAMAALSAVNRQAPTAELRPARYAQTDEADLMPYELLDAIERAAIRDKKMPLEVLRLMRPKFPQYDARQLGAWVERFFRLWARNQWKRERYAPSFHVDDENLDPKTWCRFPILSGGFERELEEMRRAVPGI